MYARTLTYVIDLGRKPPAVQGGRLRPTHHEGRGHLLWPSPGFTLYRPIALNNSSGVHGRVIWREIQGKPVLNANVLDFWLCHPQTIPRECETVCTCFFGTHYGEHTNRGDEYVRCLLKLDGKWADLDILIDGHGFASDCVIPLFHA